MPKIISLTSGRIPLPKGLRGLVLPVTQAASRANMPVYLVGGGVRDLLLGHPSLDMDVVVEGSAVTLGKAVAKATKAKLVIHPQFLTCTLHFSKGHHVDIATARKETYPESAALPVVEAASLQEDLFRRDFSINAMALSLNENDLGHLWDPYDGVKDLTENKIRVLHDHSFKDDPTRIFRAARFMGRFEAELEWKTREWLLESIALDVPSRLSGARLREELIPLLMESRPEPAFELLAQWGVLTYLVPSLQWDKSHHLFFSHLAKVKFKGDLLSLRLLVLLHALPHSKVVGSLSHLMFPQKLVNQVERALLLLDQLRNRSLTLDHLKGAQAKPLIPEAKLFLSEAMKIRSLFPKKQSTQQWQQFQDSTPCLSGQDVRDLGYKPGPIFTRIFDALRQARWEGKLRTREEEIRFLATTFPLDSHS